MDVNTAFDEEEVCLLLAGTKAELARGLQLLDREYRRKLSYWLRQRFPGLTAEELADCWVEALAGAYRTISTRGYDLNKPLRPFVCTILRRRAIDKVRRTTSNKDVLEQVGYALRDTQAGAKWRALNEVQRGEIQDKVRQATASLPEKQRIVMQAYVEGFPKTEEDTAELIRLVSERTGKPETRVAVTSSLREGIKKVQERLHRSGYGLGDNGEE
ncbi:MAG: hypothetical protein JWN70_5688 [Planctomycetaceae bacterium]|nr:hypothetical protein [Planctomycetaceae bacterium]